MDSHAWPHGDLIALLRPHSRFADQRHLVLLAWKPTPWRQLEPCIPSRGVRNRRQQPWFTCVGPPPPPPTQQLAVA